jgi:transposase
MEVTGSYSLELFAWLVEQQPELQPAIVNPKQAKHFHQSLALRNRTDKVDARSLGLMGKERDPRPFQPLAPEYQEIRDLMRYRRSLTTTKVAESQRLQQAQTKSLRRHLKSHVGQLEKRIEKIEKQVQKIVAASPRLSQDFKLLLTIPGVGPITAYTILGELGDLRRYNRSRQVSALSGMSPSKHQSGSSKNFTHIDRNGNPDLRAVLYLAAMAGATRQQDNSFARQYQRLLGKGKKEKQALVAVGRKIVVVARALVITQQPYQDDFRAA